jgi:peptidoglycan hydrolase-like protein with peptidoglycan-binding domain
VKALQEALIALGERVPGGADGAFGPGLEEAVKEFQAKHGLAADGVVGAGTLAALDAALGPRAAT